MRLGRATIFFSVCGAAAAFKPSALHLRVRIQPLRVSSIVAMPREVERHGKIVTIATDDELRALINPLVIDARKPSEIAANDGGVRYDGSVNVPWFDDGATEAPTLDEYKAKLEAAGCLPAEKDAPIITHCGGGGRGQKSADFIKALGYTNVHNGANADTIRAARA